MELFSEIYSTYYNTISIILSELQISEREMEKIIRKYAFSESAFYIIPKLKNEWLLMSEKDGIYKSKLKNKPNMPLTELEKRWLKSIINDKKIHLFLDEKTISKMSLFLTNVKPLFSNDNFFCFDRFLDGDDYLNPEYIDFFRQIHHAINKRQILNITFTSSKNNKISHNFLPLKLEYSPKNDKFRVYSAIINKGNAKNVGIINISRINSIKNTGKTYDKPIQFKDIFQKRKCKEPVCVEISPERNGVERFMLEFASYEKHTELNEENGKCTALIWYNSLDETEVLIRLLSFGSVLEIKSPEYFKNLAKERVERQYKLFHNFTTVKR